jgi:predicted AAA+ superfamily ATPase
MVNQIPRGLARRLSSSQSVPVVILEGARGAGKTTLAREWLVGKQGSFIDLTLRDQRTAAQTDGEAFVEGLRVPCVIDEAQLVPELTIDLKRRVDRADHRGQFLLTGSSRLRSDALGGSDPLAGRSERLRLFGLTQGERAHTPVSIIDWLHEGKFQDQVVSSAGDILDRLYAGQLPVFDGVVTPHTISSNRRSAVGDYVDAVLRDATLGTQFDRTALVELVRVVASNPAGILNVGKLAAELQVSRDTVSNRLSLLENAFLINRLPALASNARRELMGHPRLVPSDTALTPWALGMNRARLRERTDVTGGLLHTLIANELLTQASWSPGGPKVAHWRSGDDEADLVLQFDDGTLIPIEIKFSKTVSSRSARGIAAFLKTHDRANALGIVFYTGDEIRRLDESIWAVPISCLWNQEFDMDASSNAYEGTAAFVPERESSSGLPTEQPSETALFLSYVHEDDLAEQGRITQLGRDLAERYRLITGEAIEVFIDKDSLRWGEEWQSRIDDQLLRTTFFIPVVTPRFLKSRPCRDEVTTFESTARVLGTEAFILPILWNDLRKTDADDPIASTLRSHQWVDWTVNKFEERESRDYRLAVNAMAERLAEAVDGLSSIVTAPAIDTTAPPTESEVDVLDLMERAEQAVQQLPQATASWQPALLEAFQTMIEALSNVQTGQPTNPASIRAGLAQAAGGLKGPVAHLEEETAKMRLALNQIDDSVHELLAFAVRQPEVADQLGLTAGLETLRNELPESFGLDPDQLSTFVNQLTTFGALSRELRAPARTLSDAVVFISDMETMLQNWRRELTTS